MDTINLYALDAISTLAKSFNISRSEVNRKLKVGAFKQIMGNEKDGIIDIITLQPNDFILATKGTIFKYGRQLRKLN